jgi:mannan endo-1,4-beta-mannosidase
MNTLKWIVLLIIFLTSCSQISTLQPSSTHFTISDSNILDPEGNTFIPLGVNLVGPRYGWESSGSLWTVDGTINAAPVVKTTWNFNTVRINIGADLESENPNDPCFNQTGAQCFNQIVADLDRIIQAYTQTQPKVVVMLELHDDVYNPQENSCLFENLYNTQSPLYSKAIAWKRKVNSWWRAAAIHYRNNTYVWFNIVNEPCVTTPIVWKRFSQSLANIIRNQANAQNIIVFDGMWGAQEIKPMFEGTTEPNAISGGLTIIPSESAILTYGSSINQTYGNILYAIHPYSVWSLVNETGPRQIGTAMQLRTKLSSFVDLARNRNIAIVFGEAGWWINQPNNPSDHLYRPYDFWGNPSYTKPAGIAAYSVASLKGVGILSWHGAGRDNRDLVIAPVSNPLDGTINAIQLSNGQPTNLTQAGQYLWNLTHP